MQFKMNQLGLNKEDQGRRKRRRRKKIQKVGEREDKFSNKSRKNKRYPVDEIW